MFRPHLAGFGDVALLRRLGTAAEEQDDDGAVLAVVDTVASTGMDAHLPDPPPDGAVVSEGAIAGAVDSIEDRCLTRVVTDGVQPFLEDILAMG